MCYRSVGRFGCQKPTPQSQGLLKVMSESGERIRRIGNLHLDSAASWIILIQTKAQPQDFAKALPQPPGAESNDANRGNRRGAQRRGQDHHRHRHHGRTDPPGLCGAALQGRTRLHRPVLPPGGMRCALAQSRHLAAAARHGPRAVRKGVVKAAGLGGRGRHGPVRRPLQPGRGGLHRPAGQAAERPGGPGCRRVQGRPQRGGRGAGLPAVRPRT